MSCLQSIEQPRSEGGLFASVPALKRFINKTKFDPCTGCVLWTGGTTSGKGNSAVYGSFWYEGHRWFAHRWAAQFIHGLDIDGLQVAHVCPEGPDGLCVHHVEGQTQLENLKEMNDRRRALARQDASTKQYWLLVGLGFEELPPVEKTPEEELIPFYEEPLWYKTALDNLGLTPKIDPSIVPF